ncbi:MAG: alpha-ribazole phosphatase, partial [Verrucomicrobiaceae bacterium]|nr:alpha-ribazole phosphatase [Verrucomicrobiaceae bacterium]
PLVRRSGLVPQIMDDLREVDFGDWTGHHWESVQEHFGVSAFDWLEIMDSSGIPNGESSTQLMDRVRPCLKQILADHPHGNVAVVCHGGIIRALLALLLELPLAKMAHFNIEYGSVTVVEIQPERKHAVQVELLNALPIVELAGR